MGEGLKEMLDQVISVLTAQIGSAEETLAEEIANSRSKGNVHAANGPSLIVGLSIPYMSYIVAGLGAARLQGEIVKGNRDVVWKTLRGGWATLMDALTDDLHAFMFKGVTIRDGKHGEPSTLVDGKGREVAVKTGHKEWAAMVLLALYFEHEANGEKMAIAAFEAVQKSGFTWDDVAKEGRLKNPEDARELWRLAAKRTGIKVEE